MNPSLPPVTISILNYRRRDALDRVLRSILAQEYPSVEILVVENGSGDGTADWIRSEYPRVRLMDLQKNHGTFARNYGIEAAAGEIVVTLDNDVYFDDPRDVHRIVAAFERHPEAGCLAFRVYHPQTGRLHARDWCHPRPWQQAETIEFETYYITEGASAFRRAVFERVQPYWKDLFIGLEGFDLALRLMDAGHQIWYVPEVKVWHMASLETRESWRPFYYNTRNLFLVAFRNYPSLRGLLHVVPRVLVLGFYALRHGHFGRFLAGVMDGVRGFAAVRPLRRPVAARTLDRISEMRKDMPGPATRFLRHWKKLEF